MTTSDPDRLFEHPLHPSEMTPAERAAAIAAVLAAGLLADPADRTRFALIHGPALAGLYPTADEAVAAGYDRFGLAPFLVRRVTDPDPLPFIPPA